MTSVKDIFNVLNEIAPVNRKMDFDNVGILVGNPESCIERVVIALDITDAVVNEAIETGAQLIISHHPIFFSLKDIRSDDLIGRTVISLVKNDISAICMHTNLDVSYKGVNDALTDRLMIKNVKCISVDGIGNDGNEYGLGRYGEIDHECNLESFLSFVKKKLLANGLRYVDAGRKVKVVAVCGGSGGSELQKAYDLGCDTFVTADVKYNTFLDAANLKINLIDAGHFPTENVVVGSLKNLLSKNFPDIDFTISAVHKQVENFFL